VQDASESQTDRQMTDEIECQTVAPVPDTWVVPLQPEIRCSQATYRQELASLNLSIDSTVDLTVNLDQVLELDSSAI